MLWGNYHLTMQQSLSATVQSLLIHAGIRQLHSAELADPQEFWLRPASSVVAVVGELLRVAEAPKGRLAA